MGRALKYDIPGDDPRIAVDALADQGLAGCFGDALAPGSPFVLEIGFGRGEFLLELAAKEPDAGFIGVEVSFKRALKMARRVARSELCNVRLVEARGQTVVKLLAPGSIRDVWINFSDPWPKKRHASRRLFQREFVGDVAKVLAPNGRLRAATDDPEYAEWIDVLLSGEGGLANAFAPEPWRPRDPSRLQTSYELDWIAEGRKLHFFEYLRPGDPEIVVAGEVATTEEGR